MTVSISVVSRFQYRMPILPALWVFILMLRYCLVSVQSGGVEQAVAWSST